MPVVSPLLASLSRLRVWPHGKLVPAVLLPALLLGAAPAAKAMTIVRTDDPSVAQNLSPVDKASADAAFDYAAAQFTGRFNNPIQLNFTMVAAPGQTILGQSQGASNFEVTYDQLRTALINHAKSPDDNTSVATLPATDPTPATSWLPSRAQSKALGLIPSDTAYDGTFTFGAGFSYAYDPRNRAVVGKYDFIAIAEHEISELMGRIPGLGFGGGIYTPYDLFRYTAPQKRGLTSGNNIYFSIDSGNTNLKNYNFPNGDGSDPQDWAAGTNDAFNASGPPNEQDDFSAVDIRVMDILGYDLVTGAPVSAAITAPAKYATSSPGVQAPATGTAAGGLGGVTGVKIRLYRVPNGSTAGGYWDGVSATNPSFYATTTVLSASSNNAFANWSFALPNLRSGSYNLYATAYDAAANRGDAFTNFVVNNPGAVTAAITSPAMYAARNVGAQASAVGTTTGNVSSLAVRLYRRSGTPGYWDGASTSNPIFSGTATNLPVTSANSYANWSVALPNLAAGTYGLYASAYDSSGNRSDAYSLFYTYNFDAVSSTIVSPAVHQVRAAGAQTDGTGTTGGTRPVTQMSVRLYQLPTGGNAGGYWDGVSTTTPTFGGAATDLAVSTANAYANWSAALPSLVAGTYNFYATAFDAAGDRSDAYVQFTVQGPANTAPSGLDSGSTANASSSTVTLNFQQSLDQSVASDPSHYSVSLNGAATTVQGAAYSSVGTSVTLTLPDGTLTPGDKLVVNWYNLRTQSGSVFSGQSTLTAG